MAYSPGDDLAKSLRSTLCIQNTDINLVENDLKPKAP